VVSTIAHNRVTRVNQSALRAFLDRGVGLNHEIT